MMYVNPSSQFFVHPGTHLLTLFTVSLLLQSHLALCGGWGGIGEHSSNHTTSLPHFLSFYIMN